ncbi:MAG: hypothetical protein ACK2UX_22495, partial [Anaerolineae bacterium]
VDESSDRLQIDMAGAYPASADLDALLRTVVLHREAPRGWVEVIDRVRFASSPGTFESVLTTFAEVEIEEGAVLLRGERGALRVRFSEGVTPRYEVVENVDMARCPTDVGRVILALDEPAQEATVRLQIEPV